MYSIRAILDKEPAAIAEAIRVILPVLILLGVLHLSSESLAGIVLALSAVLTLFVRNASTSKVYPNLPSGTEVKVSGTQDSVIVEASPPGPVGIEGGQG